METYEYGHNPFGAMFACQECGRRFRTPERLRDHEDNDQEGCQELALMRGKVSS